MKLVPLGDRVVLKQLVAEETTTMRMKVTKGIIMKRKLLQPDIPMR